MNRKTTVSELSEKLAISASRASLSMIKTKLISEIDRAIKIHQITHEEVSKNTGIPRTAITGILSGSLQKVTIDRLLRILESLNLKAEIKVKKAA
jgi:predicted XRE-type DNA-binding protein